MPYKITKRTGLKGRGTVYYLRRAGSNEIISRHTSRTKAIKAMRAREAAKHGAVMRG